MLGETSVSFGKLSHIERAGTAVNAVMTSGIPVLVHNATDAEAADKMVVHLNWAINERIQQMVDADLQTTAPSLITANVREAMRGWERLNVGIMTGQPDPKPFQGVVGERDISEFDLETSDLRVLRKHGINTWQDLVNTSEKQLLSAWFSQSTVDSLKEQMAKHGLYLNTTGEKVYLK